MIAFAVSLLALSTLAASSGTTGSVCGVERTASGLRFVRDGRAVWNFEIDADDGKPYVHPLCSPSGATLTDLRPADHVWHKGLWFSWKFLNGVNYWETPEKAGPGGAGRTTLVSRDVEVRGLGATVRLALSYSDAGGEVLAERRAVEFPPPDADGGYAILFVHEFTASRDVKLDRTPPYRRADGAWAGGYAGLTLRLAPLAAAGFSERRDGKGFVTFACPKTGESVVLRAVEEPEGAKFYGWPDRRMLNLSPLYDRPLELKKGEKLRLRYAVEVRAAKTPATAK